uniref:Microtubule-associated protein futsch n=1 Tax=Caenorhabditis tropicalis TaxID=1561998 RepID=A0A1I7UAU5_9PELO
MQQRPAGDIESSKACVYVLGSTGNTSSLFDFNGVCVLDGGFAESNKGLVESFEVAAVIFSAPTIANVLTTKSLLEKDTITPVLMNTKPLNKVTPGSSGVLVKLIQEKKLKLLNETSICFNPNYPAIIIHQSMNKGTLSLYILAGDDNDAEIITKALASGNEATIEKVAAEHGTIGILLWRPANADENAIRTLIAGTCSLSRIQQSIDKAVKHLPFLTVPSVKSGDALKSVSMQRRVPYSSLAMPKKSTATNSATSSLSAPSSARLMASRASSSNLSRTTKSVAPSTSKPSDSKHTGTTKPYQVKQPGASVGSVRASVPAAKKPDSFTQKKTTDIKHKSTPTDLPTKAKKKESTPSEAYGSSSAKSPVSASSQIVEPKANDTIVLDDTADISEEMKSTTGESQTENTCTKGNKSMGESMDPSTTSEDMPQLSHEPQKLSLDEKSTEYVDNFCDKIMQEVISPSKATVSDNTTSSKESQEHQSPDVSVNTSDSDQDLQKGIPKIKETDDSPSNDDSDTLLMPNAPGSSMTSKSVKFARPYYFDVVTVPRNKKMGVSVTVDGLQEFVSKIRSKNIILPSKNISSEHLQALVTGKQTWCDSNHPCTIIPTHSSTLIEEFRQQDPDHFTSIHLTVADPVDKHMTSISSTSDSAECNMVKVLLDK